MADRSPRQRAWRGAVPLVMLLVGGLLATSSQLAHGTDLRVGRKAELADLIAVEERRGEQYRRQLAELRAEMESASRREATRDSRIEAARARAKGFAPAAAFTSITGSGLRVTLDDASGTQSRSQLPGNPTPNDLVVHQQDVQAVVNALWAGGARGLQIMGKRVIASSAVRCVGNTLILQGVVYSPPYTITAAGDPQDLRAALDASPQVRIYRQYVQAYGLGYKVEELERVTLPGYDGLPDLQYASVLAS